MGDGRETEVNHGRLASVLSRPSSVICPPSPGEACIQQLLSRLAQSRAALKAKLDGLRDDRVATAEVMPGYTIRDLMAVSAAWDQTVLTTIEAYLNHDQPPRLVMEDVEAWNRQARDRRRDLPLMQLRMSFLMTRGELGSLLAIAPPETVDEEIEYPWGERGTVRRLVERYCIARDLEYADHIEAWRVRAGE